MHAVLATLYEAIVDLAIAIQPIIPAAAAKLLDAMGVPAGERDYAALADEGRYGRLAASGFILAPPSPIFPRLDAAGGGLMRGCAPLPSCLPPPAPAASRHDGRSDNARSRAERRPPRPAPMPGHGQWRPAARAH